MDGLLVTNGKHTIRYIVELQRYRTNSCYYTVDLSMMMSFGIGMYLQGLFLVLLKVILLKLRVINTFRENYWCNFFTETQPI